MKVQIQKINGKIVSLVEVAEDYVLLTEGDSDGYVTLSYETWEDSKFLKEIKKLQQKIK